MKIIYKFNNGNGATLCNRCSKIIATGKKVERLYCDSCQKGINEIKVNIKDDRRKV